MNGTSDFISCVKGSAMHEKLTKVIRTQPQEPAHYFFVCQLRKLRNSSCFLSVWVYSILAYLVAKKQQLLISKVAFFWL